MPTIPVIGTPPHAITVAKCDASMRGMGSLGRNSWGGYPLKDPAIGAILEEANRAKFR
jgi:hypothetical protein